MFKRKVIFGIATLAISAALILLPSCRRRSANERRYDLKGKVVAVEKDKRLVTISHEDIKGYMPGMVMPFTVKEDSALEILVTGRSGAGHAGRRRSDVLAR